ncbi:MAG: hypothetical protein ACREI3_08060, partial [Nitrospirales bacterium]
MTPRPRPPDDLHRDAASRSAVALLRDQRGVTNVMALFLVLIMGISMMAVGKQWKVIVQRDKEAELLFRGNRIKAAIEAYAADYEVKKATRATRYPQSLE